MNIFNVGSRSVNVYLLDSGSHRLLIDSGFPGSLHELGRGMCSTGYRIWDIDYLMVTHFHIDHAGAVQELKGEGVKALIFDTQADAIQHMEAMAGAKWNYTPLLLSDNIILQAVESRSFLKGLNIQGRILGTPGHSNDSISLLLDSGEAFTGDLAAEFLVGDEDAVTKDSWARLKAGGASRIFPGHGAAYDVYSG